MSREFDNSLGYNSHPDVLYYHPETSPFSTSIPESLDELKQHKLDQLANSDDFRTAMEAIVADRTKMTSTTHDLSLSPNIVQLDATAASKENQVASKSLNELKKVYGKDTIKEVTQHIDGQKTELPDENASVINATINGKNVKLQGYRFEGNNKVIKGQISRNQQAVQGKGKHLSNVFVQTIKNREKVTHTSIRHGKIKDRTALEQFKALILELKASGELIQQPNGRYRVTSSSLLNASFIDKESGWINKHHAMIDELAKELKKEPHNIDLVFFQFQVHGSMNRPTNGEFASCLHNREGLKQYVSFFIESLEGQDIVDGSVLAEYKNISIHDQKAWDKFLSFLLQLIGIVTGKSSELSVLKNIVQKSTNPEVAAAARALHNLISANLGKGSISRHQELISLSVLDKYLGINRAMNCKSASDRTGLVHAVHSSVHELIEEKGWDAALRLVTEFDTMAEEIDRETYEMKAEQYNTYANDLRNDAKRDILTFRNLVAQNLIYIAHPITAFYSGMPGLKIGKHAKINSAEAKRTNAIMSQYGKVYGKYFQHPLPPKFLPRYLSFANGNTLQVTELVDKGTGEVAFTQEGRKYFTDAAYFRGS